MNLQLTTHNLQRNQKSKFKLNLFLNFLKAKKLKPRTTDYGLRTSSGFTLVETLVAIFILMIAVISPMSIASKALSSARYAKEQVTAFYLAQEGVELVRNIRDNNALAGATWNEGSPSSLSYLGSSSLLSVCYSSDGCIIEPKIITVRSCSGACDPLHIAENGIYTYDTSNAVATRFTRKIKITKISANEISVSSNITWTSQIGGSPPTFTITDTLFQWQ